MLKYNDNTLYKLYNDGGELIKAYYHDNVYYYQISGTPPTPSIQYRWVVVASSYECSGTTKMTQEKEQYSTDSGVTWSDVSPLTTRAALPVIAYESEDCGYVPPTPSFDGKFKLILDDSSVVSAECDATSAVTSANVYTQYATTLASAEIGDCVTEIGRRAFFRCSAMTSCDFGKNITTIGQEAFRQCFALSSITLPNSVTSINASAFAYCSGLTSVSIGSGVTTIGKSAFYHCRSLRSIDIPSSVTSIGNNAFGYCYSLTSVTIPNFDISFESSIFRNCTGLTTLGLEGSGASIEIPNGTTTIGANIFNTSSLTSATIPSSVTTIGKNAFSSSAALMVITFYATTPPTLGRQAFYSISGRCKVYVPAASVDAYNSVLSEYNLTAQPIPT